MVDRRSAVPAHRQLPLNERPVRRDGDYVLYWIVAARRTRWSFGLQRAVEAAAALERPLVVLEALRVDYPWASPRLHRFVLDGMADNQRRLGVAGVTCLSYVEPTPGAGRGLLAALAARACLVITDHFPCGFLPRMVQAAGDRLPVYTEAVDGNGLLPLIAAERSFTTAASFRRFLQKTLRQHLVATPEPEPLSALPRTAPAQLDPAIRTRWPGATPEELEDPSLLASLPLSGPAPVSRRGGTEAAGLALARFLKGGLSRYADGRNHPDQEISSGLSPWLHFGHLSTHELAAAVLAREAWTPAQLASGATGSRTGWWGLSPEAEAFLDQLVTWRELGYVFCDQNPETYSDYDALPDWALTTLAAHASDERPYLYTLDQLDRAETHDRLWNAAQTQLVREGTIHSYLRMLWGKKILEWSPSPREALEVMIQLNNRYALDGRDPNSYSGIFWVLGRFDRAWGPERPIFGKVRYMSSQSAARKLRLRGYLEKYAPAPVSAG